MTFEITPNVSVKRNNNGIVRQLYHPRQPYTVRRFAADRSLDASLSADVEIAPRVIAEQYVREVLPAYQLDSELSADLNAAVAEEVIQEESRLKFLEEKVTRNQVTVSYAQTYMGLLVWEAGLTVRMRNHPLSVTSSQSAVHTEIEVEPPPSDAQYMPEHINADILANLLALEANKPRPEVNSKRLLIYQYNADDRGNGYGEPEENDETQVQVAAPKLIPPPIPSHFQSGQYYIVVEVLFTLNDPNMGSLNWRAFIEPESGTVLYLSAFIGCLDGHVYLQDPLTKTGDQSIKASSPVSILNSLRDRVTLFGLQPPPQIGTPQKLEGEFVKIVNISSPNSVSPTTIPPNDFSYSVPTDDFAAVNAYYHCDRLFRMMEEMGFDVKSYFDGTTFPVSVDHRVQFRDRFGNLSSNVVNAQAPGNIFGNGSDGFRFALVEKDTQVGMAVEWRVVLHEFGHAILWDNVNSPNFKFAHSAGDSLAAILNDAESKAPDRGLTYPWTIIPRRHDHSVSSGYAWGGNKDDRFTDRAGYEREQILSSTLFKLYRAIGGDHKDLEVRRFAARYVTYLIFESIGTLSSTAQPEDAQEYANILMESDMNTLNFEGQPGGTVHKVIRWAFEQQGLYQPPGTPRPINTAGFPPEVDVYIDDGRKGSYEPLSTFSMGTNDIWIRHNPDHGLEHQIPVSGTNNFIYVKVKNRGITQANNIKASAFVTEEEGDKIWPSAWENLTASPISAGASISSNSEVIIGPFEWQPKSVGNYSLLLSVTADNDISNIDLLDGNGSIPVAKLVHCDNNIAVQEFTAIASE
ncbi:hypothetical protein [Mastigocoleus testarum]|uniref:FTP domain-containing protein n=1 Tax=Mastigocoleus testarum BC008 TaxID=371196 RepID=A0A0V7ZYL2_9CYAN|nr:hypothetical protein [Mastigocoleus testarum]KST69496.1 hypothetical protein BC008_04140 [Mastigocoleus testarum BC008]KST69538.1 hypothetical protein BC008_04350 [Mastigocoleus testarum BC008]